VGYPLVLRKLVGAKATGGGDGSRDQGPEHPRWFAAFLGCSATSPSGRHGRSEGFESPEMTLDGQPTRLKCASPDHDSHLAARHIKQCKVTHIASPPAIRVTMADGLQ
jgi:hypothetical protein